MEHRPHDGAQTQPGGRPKPSALLRGALLVAYPLLVYVALSRGARPRRVAAAIALLYVAAFVAGQTSLRGRRWIDAAKPLWPVLAALAAAALLDDPRGLWAVPVLVNLALLGTFAASLRPGSVPLVERFARAVHPNLGPPAVRHCRQVTVAWCVFFAANAAATALLAWLDPALWALHTGVFAYLVMGLLFAGEWLLRRIRSRRGDWYTGPEAGPNARAADSTDPEAP